MITLFPICTGERKSILYEPIEEFSPMVRLVLARQASSFIIIVFSPMFAPCLIAFFWLYLVLYIVLNVDKVQ